MENSLSAHCGQSRDSRKTRRRFLRKCRDRRRRSRARGPPLPLAPAGGARAPVRANLARHIDAEHRASASATRRSDRRPRLRPRRAPVSTAAVRRAGQGARTISAPSITPISGVSRASMNSNLITSSAACRASSPVMIAVPHETQTRPAAQALPGNLDHRRAACNRTAPRPSRRPPPTRHARSPSRPMARGRATIMRSSKAASTTPARENSRLGGWPWAPKRCCSRSILTASRRASSARGAGAARIRATRRKRTRASCAR